MSLLNSLKAENRKRFWFVTNESTRRIAQIAGLTRFRFDFGFHKANNFTLS